MTQETAAQAGVCDKLDVELQLKIDRLLADPGFLELLEASRRSNLFETLAASHLELWHSAFIKWIIDPNSGFGLGDFPLKRFLCLVALESTRKQGTEDVARTTLDIAQIETSTFSKVHFTLEYKKDERLKNEAGKRVSIDIFAEGNAEREGKAGPSESDTEKSWPLRLVIENKVRAIEARDQTLVYRQFAQDTNQNSCDLLVFLTPDANEFAKDKYFVRITYQQVCDKVLLPCLKHPLLSSENHYLLEQYLSNLSTYDEELEGPMANSNRELCREIFHKHRDVLMQIYSEVEEEAHINMSSLPGTGKAVYETSISDLFDHGNLSPTDTLIATWKKMPFRASMRYDKNEGAAIVWEGKQYLTPSAAAWAIRQKSTNGWTFWTVVSADGKKKGTLADLRASLPAMSQPDDSAKEE